MKRRNFLLSLPLIGMAAKVLAEPKEKNQLRDISVDENSLIWNNGTLSAEEGTYLAKLLKDHPLNNNNKIKNGSLVWKNGFNSRVFFKPISE